MLSLLRQTIIYLSLAAGSAGATVPVSFTLTLDPAGPVRFTDGYPREASAYASPRRRLKFEGEVTPEIQAAGNVVRLRFQRPFEVRTDERGVTSTLVFTQIDVRFRLADFAAFVKLTRVREGEVVIKEDAGPRGLTLNEVLTRATASASLQALADLSPHVPRVYALAGAAPSLGHIPFAVLRTGVPVDVDFDGVKLTPLDDSDVPQTVPTAALTKWSRRHVLDGDVLRYLEITAKLGQIRRQTGTVVRPRFGGDCVFDLEGRGE